MAAERDSVLLQPWPGPHGGVPPWDAIDPEEFAGAFERAIAEADHEIEAIAVDPEPPTFENTIVALERAGRRLERVAAQFGVHTANLNRDPIPRIRRTVGPLLAAHADRVIQNEKLFARIEAVHEALDAAALDGPSQRLVEDRHRQFVRRGAELDAARKEELAAINQDLARLHTEFSQNVLDDEAGRLTWIEDPAELAGLPDSLVETLAGAATERGREGAWAVPNTRSSMDPVLTMAEDRGLRERVWRTYYTRAEGIGGGHDNRPIIGQILSLRARRAALLGYASHAHWQLEVAMAKEPDAAMALMMEVWPHATARAREEVADMERLAGHPIEPWDYRFWAERVRKQTYDVDSAEIKPYLQLERLIEAMLWCSTELYGLHYRLLEPGTVPVFHPDVRVWEVTNPAGEHVALWYLDPYARPGKLSGAWMTAYRSQERLDGEVTPLVSNNSNFVKPPSADRPVLVTWDEATTLFHEFGHALHGMLSDVTYPSQAGTAVCRDYVEFPSQLNEHWLMTDEVLERFCRHHRTGDPMPPELMERIRRAENFNQGFDTVEYLAAALYDLRIHLAVGDGVAAIGDGTDERAAALDPLAFEAEVMAELDLPSQIVMRHRPTHFTHIFSGDGYSAAYYSYLWADALTADAAEAFTEAGGFFDPEVAARLRANVLSVGDTVDPADGFRAFRGRDVDTGALLRKRGFA